MSEILHAWALAPAAIGTCCLAADRRRVRAPELVASLLMLVAMLDAALAHLVPPVYWAASLLASGMALAAWRSRTRRRIPGLPHSGTLHATLGLVVMGALLVAMGHAPTPTGAHEHGPSAAAVTALVLAGALAHAVGSAVVATRARGLLNRAQYALMGASTAAMGIAVVLT